MVGRLHVQESHTAHQPVSVARHGRTRFGTEHGAQTLRSLRLVRHFGESVWQQTICVDVDEDPGERAGRAGLEDGSVDTFDPVDAVRDEQTQPTVDVNARAAGLAGRVFYSVANQSRPTSFGRRAVGRQADQTI